MSHIKLSLKSGDISSTVLFESSTICKDFRSHKGCNNESCHQIHASAEVFQDSDENMYLLINVDTDHLLANNSYCKICLCELISFYFYFQKSRVFIERTDLDIIQLHPCKHIFHRCCFDKFDSTRNLLVNTTHDVTCWHRCCDKSVIRITNV